MYRVIDGAAFLIVAAGIAWFVVVMLWPWLTGPDSRIALQMMCGMGALLVFIVSLFRVFGLLAEWLERRYPEC